MEQRPVEPLHERHPGRGSLEATVSLAALQLLPQVAAARGAGRVMAVRDGVRLAVADAAASRFLRPLALQFLLVHVVLCGGRGAVLPTDFRHAEYGLPALKAGRVALRGGETEAGRGEGSFGPSVFDAGEMPVYRVRGGVAVELIADIDEVLDGRDIDIVDGGEVEDDGFEGRFFGLDGYRLAAAGARVVPRTVLICVLTNDEREQVWGGGAYAEFRVERGVGAARLFEESGDHVVKVVVCVGVVEAFREAVDEDAWVR